MAGALLLGGGACAAVADIGTSGSGGRDAEHTGTKGKSGDGEDDAKAVAKKERELVEKLHELEQARLKNEVSERELLAKSTASDRALAVAEYELAEAESALEVFLSTERPVKLGRAELALARAEQRLEESRAELEELEAMYEENDFAERTKELVVTRGRRNLEQAEKALRLEQREFEQLQTYELPKAEREQTRAVEKARADLAEKRAEHETEALEARIEVREKQFELQQLEYELGLLKKELAELAEAKA